MIDCETFYPVNNNNKPSTKTKVKSQKLNVLTTNICGLKSKTGSLTNILHENNIDIACVSETHFEGDAIPEIKGYITYHRNRIQKAKGGICMFIKKEYEQWVVKMESGLDANEYFVCKLGCFEPELVLVLQYGVIESRFTTSEILEIQSEVFNVVKSYCDMGHDVLWTGDMNLHVGNKGKLRSNNPTQ